MGLFVSSLLLGLAFSALPGAVNAESLRRGMARGFVPAVSVQLGSLVGDMVWAALALGGATFFLGSRSIRLTLALAGAVFLLWLARSAFLAAGGKSAPEHAGAGTRGDFLTGAVFSFTNAVAPAFWLGMGAGATASAHGRVTGAEEFFAGFFAGALAWCIGSAAAIAWGRRRLQPSFFRWIDALCGAALSYLGVRLLWTSLKGLRFLRVLTG